MTATTTLSSEAQAQIVLAAVSAVGPTTEAPDETWSAQVARKSAEIYLLAYGDRSPAVRAINGVRNAKVFTGTILDVSKEATSTRGIVKLKTRPTSFHPDGIETARTERTDEPSGRVMARALRAVTGHRVVIWVEVEDINGGSGKVRMVRHFEDLGPDHSVASNDETS
jgi:hypothetical protein